MLITWNYASTFFYASHVGIITVNAKQLFSLVIFVSSTKNIENSLRIIKMLVTQSYAS